MTLDADVTLDNSKGAGILVGVDHQTWDRWTKDDFSYKDQFDDAYANTYSIFLNKKNINLDSGSNMLGIMIDVEHSAADNSYKRFNHKTIMMV